VISRADNIRKILGTVFLLILVGTSDAVGQERGSLGFYTGANISDVVQSLHFGLSVQVWPFGVLRLGRP
jgi:hypothetical protein